MTNDRKIIKINGTQYTENELRKKSAKDLHIEVLVAIGKVQSHIEIQDKANEKRLGLHEKLIIGLIFSVLSTIIGLIAKIMA